jgi:heme oxygenase
VPAQRGPAEFTVTSARRADAVVLAVVGEFDIATAPVVTAGVQAELELDAGPLVVDLTATTFADSSACRVLVQTAKACRRLGRGLEIVCPPGNTAVRRVLDLVGMDAVVPLRERVADTAAAVRRRTLRRRTLRRRTVPRRTLGRRPCRAGRGASRALRVTGSLPALRAATATEHERLESRLDVPGRCATPAGYRGLLESFWGVYAELEPRLEAARAATGVLPGWSRAQGLGWLAADLDDLGCGPRERHALPRCTDLPALDAADRVWGALYVVEGAALGGGVIAAELARRDPTLPTRFFTGHGEQRGRRWHRFRRELGGRLDRPGALPVVVESARETFAAFELWCAGAPAGRR